MLGIISDCFFSFLSPWVFDHLLPRCITRGPLHAPMPQTLTRYTVSPIENDGNNMYFWCHAPSSCTQTKASLIGTSTRKQTKALRCHGQMQPELMIQHCFGRYRLFFFSFPHCMCFVPPLRVYGLNLSTEGTSRNEVLRVKNRSGLNVYVTPPYFFELEEKSFFSLAWREERVESSLSGPFLSTVNVMSRH